MCNVRYPFNEIIGTFTKKIHAYHKEQCIDNTRYQNPLPQTVLANKAMCLEIRLNGYYYFF